MLKHLKRLGTGMALAGLALAAGTLICLLALGIKRLGEYCHSGHPAPLTVVGTVIIGEILYLVGYVLSDED